MLTNFKQIALHDVACSAKIAIALLDTFEKSPRHWYRNQEQIEHSQPLACDQPQQLQPVWFYEQSPFTTREKVVWRGGKKSIKCNQFGGRQRMFFFSFSALTDESLSTKGLLLSFSPVVFSLVLEGWLTSTSSLAGKVQRNKGNNYWRLEQKLKIWKI